MPDQIYRDQVDEIATLRGELESLATIEAERDAMQPVVEAAKAWRAKLGRNREVMVFGSVVGQESRALVEAVDALDGTAGQDWIQTFTGRAFYPLSAQVDDIDPDDIAHALSLICRYGGHVTRYYSVAEHSVLLSHAVAPEDALWALLHDAAEAYVGDMVRPLKYLIPRFRAIERELMVVICDRFGLNPVCPAAVKAADTRIMIDERATLLAPSQQPWTSLEGLAPLGVTVEGWAPPVAERRFLARLDNLIEERSITHVWMAHLGYTPEQIAALPKLRTSVAASTKMAAAVPEIGRNGEDGEDHV
jgi:5'-nucleotidase